MNKFLVAFFFVLSYNFYAQEENTPTYKNGDRIVFIGNSITQDGRYHNFFQIYNATRFPSKKVSFLSAGIAGDVADGMIKRFNTDILIHKPTHAFLMTGMNDVNISLYSKEKPDAENLKKRKWALENYFVKTEKLVNMLLENNIKLTLIAPSIYDQTSQIKALNNFGANDALTICSKHIKELAKKYNLPLVDFHKVMLGVNKKEQAKDPFFTIVGADRVHPQTLGHLVMASEIIKTITPSKFISTIKINARKKKVVESFNSEVTLVESSNNLEFDVLENSLPFPIENQLEEQIKNIYPAFNTINNQILAICKLRKGSYELLIDDEKLGIFNHKELKKGINLANHKNTPQYKQAINVGNLINKYHKTQDSLRTLKFVKYRMLNEYNGKNTLEGEKEFLFAENAKSIGKSWHAWNLKNIKKYFKILPKEKGIRIRLNALRDQIYSINQPKKHIYKLIRVHE
jgi:lysophospholipase L1-like esterase